uniref:Uncharacterized protein n=1 Tax=Bionectria ochroleuca TaxID=29856 RepID=A0A8H7NPE9_BIOOC
MGRDRSIGASNRDFHSALSSSFRSSSPLAEQYLAQDIAACSDDDVESNHEDGLSEVDHHGNAGHFTYRRPSGVTYGGFRPVLNPQAAEDPGLSLWRGSSLVMQSEVCLGIITFCLPSMARESTMVSPPAHTIACSAPKCPPTMRTARGSSWTLPTSSLPSLGARREVQLLHLTVLKKTYVKMSRINGYRRSLKGESAPLGNGKPRRSHSTLHL